MRDQLVMPNTSTSRVLRWHKSPAFLLAFFGIISQWLWLDKALLSESSRLLPLGYLSPGLTSQDYISSHDYEIVTTNYGWNTPAWRNFSRRIVTGEFFNAILSHERYNASAWNDLEMHPDPKRKIVTFLDVDTCIELNYPFYGIKQWWDNLDIDFVPSGSFDPAFSSCEYISKAAKSPALLANLESRLVILDCTGNLRHHLRRTCRSAFENTQQVIIAYMSIETWHAPKMDVGLPPPAIRPIHLSTFERYKQQTCTENRTILFSFQGKLGKPLPLFRSRIAISKLDIFPDVHVRLLNKNNYVPNIQKLGHEMEEDKLSYREILQQSIFAGAPRGDNLFSYRFAEILSSGAVPVVYSDGWLPPFNEKIVNWTKCAVFIQEDNANKTRDILLAIPDNVRCQMQRCSIEFWDRYASSRAGWLRGLLEVALSSSSAYDNQIEVL